MERLEFRTLTADEIECRVAQTGKSKKGIAWCSLLLYKDARCDQRLLDETVGAFNWQRQHSRDNANCTVSIWDESKSQWISKEDTGTESNTEAEKGLASDSFKRACFNWGIGRELYTAPKIFLTLNEDEWVEQGTKIKVDPKTTFSVKQIGYDDKRKITSLIIVDGNGNTRFSLTEGKKQPEKQPQKKEEPKPLSENEEMQEAFLLIKDNIERASSRAVLQDISDNNKGLHGYEPFRAAVNKRWKEVA